MRRGPAGDDATASSLSPLASPSRTSATPHSHQHIGSHSAGGAAILHPPCTQPAGQLPPSGVRVGLGRGLTHDTPHLTSRYSPRLRPSRIAEAVEGHQGPAVL